MRFRREVIKNINPLPSVLTDGKEVQKRMALATFLVIYNVAKAIVYRQLKLTAMDNVILIYLSYFLFVQRA